MVLTRNISNTEKKPLLFFIMLIPFLFTVQLRAQLENSFDMGITFGAISMQSDYGERGEINSSLIGNIGYTASLVLYKNFYNRKYIWNSRTNWIQDHIKVKAEVSYQKNELNHFGRYIEGESNGAMLLSAMHGTSTVVNVGGGVEYHFMNLSNFGSHAKTRLFSPYASLGWMYGFSKASVVSDLGSIEDNAELLVQAYRYNSIFTQQEKMSSTIFSLGTRIGLTDYSELILDSKWQYYFSDKVDGLQPNIAANKFNDWTYSMTLGFVVYL